MSAPYVVTLVDENWAVAEDFDGLEAALRFAVERASWFRQTFEVHRLDGDGRAVKLATVHGVGRDTVALVPHADPT
jgi:hypothetical protein